MFMIQKELIISKGGLLIKYLKNPPRRSVEGSFWTAKQRKANRIHEISYRACFKPQLPNFFITQLTEPGDIIFDPFSGRGTTIIEAALLNRPGISNDVNPISKIFVEPRLTPPKLEEIKDRLEEINLDNSEKAEIDISMFYHPKTEGEIIALRNYLYNRAITGTEDHIDKWIRMVATNRLTGHSKGFFSTYTFPPNQAISQEEQKRINKKTGRKPEYKNVKNIILDKSKNLLKNITPEIRDQLANISKNVKFYSEDATSLDNISNDSIKLTVTSPPFLDVVSYSKDNWLRFWFNKIDQKEVEKKITILKNLNDWSNFISSVFSELYRITKPDGFVAFEVGEVKSGKIKLDEVVEQIGKNAGFDYILTLINKQQFTKTSNIWGVKNNLKGTNTNRIVLFKK